jgi:predicted transcriptional regulator
MAGMLYVYSRTSIKAAKANAQKHREADGGQLSWYKEGLRSHGMLEKVEKRGMLGQLFGKDTDAKNVDVQRQKEMRKQEEERLKELQMMQVAQKRDSKDV